MGREKVGWVGPAVANALNWLGVVLCDAGRPAEAEPLFREALDLAKTRFGEDSLEFAGSLAALSFLLMQHEKFAELEPLARQGLEIRQREIPDSWLAYNARLALGCSLQGQKKHEEAEQWLLSGYHGMKEREHQIPVGGRPFLPEALRALVELYEQTDRPDEAGHWRQQLVELESAAR